MALFAQEIEVMAGSAGELATQVIVPSWLGFGLLAVLAWIIGGLKKFQWRPVLLAAGLQFVLAWIVLKTDPGQVVFLKAGGFFNEVKLAYEKAMAFILGEGTYSPYSFALVIIPLVIFISSLSAILYHYRILQGLISLMAFVFRKTTGMTGPEAMAAAANIFMGMAEAPTLIGPYLKTMSRSQLFMVMTVGMATVSGALMAVYASFTESFFEGGYQAATAHLLAASVVSAPAAFLVARLMEPETPRDDGDHSTEEEYLSPVPPTTTGFFDALSHGALTGMRLTASILAIVVSVIALVHLINAGLTSIGDTSWKVENALGWLFKPVAALMGICEGDLNHAGSLLGVKVGLNDFVAFAQMKTMTFVGSERTVGILSWALCGFANFGSIGIMIGSMGGLCPERRSEIAGLGFKAMIAGFFATCLTGAVVGTLI